MTFLRSLPSSALRVGLAGVLTVALAGAALPVWAQSPAGLIKSGIDGSAGPYKGQTTDLQSIVGALIYVALSLVGVLLLVYMLYAGFLWMTAGGDKKQIDTAKDIIQNAVVGLIIIFSAYAIATFVLERLATVGSGGTVS